MHVPPPPLPKLTLGKYRHYKTRTIFEVIGVAYHSETLEPMVVYRHLDGDHSLWVRPYEMFTGMVEAEGKMVKRFELEDELNSKS